MERTVSFIVCDLCGKRSEEARDSLDASRVAIRANWKIVPFDTYGNEGHACPKCASMCRLSEIRERILAKGVNKEETSK